MGCLQWFLIVLASSLIASGQQTYEKPSDCSNPNPPNNSYGYTCNGQNLSCQAYAIYRAQAGYRSLQNISSLLNSDQSQMAQINMRSDTQVLDIDTEIIAPITCSCAGNYSQVNATYFIGSGETILIMANNIYEGLSTCQAIKQQNSGANSTLQSGMGMTVPVRCACPTPAQVGKGILYLLSYLVRERDTPDTIAKKYSQDGATTARLLDANDLNANNETIFPSTTLLVPLQKTPTNPPPPTSIPASPSKHSGWNRGLRLGLGVGISAAVIAAAAACCILFAIRKRKRQHLTEQPSSEMKIPNEATVTPTELPDELAVRLRKIGQTLPQYELKELEAATGNFNSANQISGSVYRGTIDETPVAIKKMQRDVSQDVRILEKLHHFNLVRLLGFCVSDTHSYLVFENADNGSLADCLQSNSPFLSWRRRLEIALDVADGLSYLHNYSVPPYVHKDIKSSNVLLDRNIRAKIANFGLAKSAEEGFYLTRHVNGTKGYMAPEYLADGLVTPKLDIFSFGVVMLELLSGKPAVLRRDGDVMLWTTIESVVEGSNPKEKLKGFMDLALQDDYPLEIAFAMARLTRRCVHEDLNSRPTISEIQIALSTLLSASAHHYNRNP